jgi:hypothetical protein
VQPVQALRIAAGTSVHVDITLQQVARAVRGSTAFVAAFCRADALPEAFIHDFPGRLRLDDATGNDAWQLKRSAKRQKILIGIALATCDRNLVGTFERVVVFPPVRFQGLGRRCAPRWPPMYVSWYICTLHTRKLPPLAAVYTLYFHRPLYP